MRSLFKKHFAVFIGSAVALASLYMMTREDWLENGVAGNRERAGVLVSASNDVRTKSAKSYFWSPAVLKTSLYYGDSIFSGPNSVSVVSLENGQEIHVAENSMLKFKKVKDQLRLEIPFGEIETKKMSSDFVIVDCNREYHVTGENSEMRITKDHGCGPVKFQLKSGQAKVNNEKVAEFSKRKPKTGILEKVAEVEPIAVLAASPVPVELAAPVFKSEVLSYVVKTHPAPVILEWPAVAQAQKYTLEVADNSAFSQPQIFTQEQTSFDLTSLKEIPGGALYVRVKALPGSEKEAESRFSSPARVNVIFPKISLRDPSVKKDYTARHSQDEGSSTGFKLAWSEVAGTEKYQVEAYEEGKPNVKLTTVSRSPAAVLTVPKTGHYIYSVKALDKNGRQISSSSGTGEILYNKVFDMKTPAIAADLLRQFYFFQAGAGRFIRLFWQAEVKENTAFTVQISKSKEFETLVSSHSAKRASFLLQSELPEGSYFWRVRAEKDGQISDWSPVAVFSISSGRKPASAPVSK